MTIPRWARAYLRPEDPQKISDAVFYAERSCGAELVPVIVRSSSGTGHVGLSLGLILLLSLYYFRFAHPGPADEAWRHWGLPLIEAALAGIAATVLSRFAFIQRLLTPRLDRLKAVDRRARLEYYKHQVEKTKTGNGVLLFVSLMEHRAVVLCGPGIAAKVPNEAWDGVVRELSLGAKSGQLGEGVVKALEKSAEMLKKKFKAKKKTKNELSDRLVVKE